MTKQIHVGNVAIGGDAPVSIQSMTNTPTRDPKKTIEQINILANAGCNIIRVAVPTDLDAMALPEIVKASPIPVIADIHFDYRLAIKSIEAGVHGLRLNPGNIGSTDKVKEVVRAAKDRMIPIRIGANGGSLSKEILERYNGVCSKAIVESALSHVRILEDLDYREIKISLKSSDVPMMIDSYRMISRLCDYPLHVGVTEAGFGDAALIKSSIGIGTLLSEGIGNTIRVSLTDYPLREVEVAEDILKSLNLLKKGFNLVSCPTCGRTEVDLIGLAHEVRRRLDKIQLKPNKAMTIAVMGCVVNGPGEARHADFGIAGGKNKGMLFAKGEEIGVYNQDELVDALIEKILQTDEVLKG